MFYFQFHWYGFFLGLAAVVGFSLVEYQAKKRAIPLDLFWRASSWVIAGGVIGARAWHVMTDYSLYVNNWLNIFAIWQGGLSIIGCVTGALIAFYVFFWFHSGLKKYQLQILDMSIFGLPIAQAIGRFGNYANQELYGFPTDLFFAIKIDISNRLNNYEQFSTFHPLFAYEGILLLFFAVGIWLNESHLKVGNGRLFLSYVAYYCFVRFSLDFLRIDKTTSFIVGLGFNQVVLLIVGIIVVGYLSTEFLEQRKRNKVSK